MAANYTAQQIADLRAAIASGVLSTGHGDKRVSYRSLPEMKESLRIMIADCNTAATGRRNNAGFAGFSRGNR